MYKSLTKVAYDRVGGKEEESKERELFQRTLGKNGTQKNGGVGEVCRTKGSFFLRWEI